MRVVGRYVVFDEIAAGGMAAVHLGACSRRRASRARWRSSACTRSSRAIRTSSRCSSTRPASRRHPNVVPTLDIVSEGDEVLLVMEYVAGESLSRLMRLSRPGRMPLPVAVAVMTAMLHGLHAAHEAKTEQGVPLAIVHRDVSPQNILVGVDGVSVTF